jgi:hypothetical protein
MSVTVAKHSLRCLLLVLLPFFTCGEGIKELMPDSTVSAAELYFNNNYTWAGIYTNFGLANCPPNYRLYIHVKNPGESILFGMNSYVSGYQFNLRKPDGTIALSGTCPSLPGQPGYIRYYHQAVTGPFPATGGYTPFEYPVTSIADTGDYYFEIANLPLSDDMVLPLWDFQVVSGLHSPALPSDTINGRVWSQSWQVEAVLGYYQVFNGSLYVLSDDGIVTKLKFTDARVGVVTVFCNPTGCYNTGNPLSDRKSSPVNTFSSFPGIAQYKVFLNNPDVSVYPSGFFGSITADPSLIPDPAFPPCSGEKLVVVSVNKAGTTETDLFFPYGAPATNVALSSPVTAGTNYIAWDGLDGLGNPVPDGTVVTLRVIYMNGLTNLPVWDQEQNPEGYQLTLVRPFNPVSQVPLIFWDDSSISGTYCPTTTNLVGCIPYPAGCHTWSGYDCHDKMINSWWYGSSDTATGLSLFALTPSPATGHDSARCGPGSVMLHATVPAHVTVDWYDTISGGIPLLTGDTTFLTPFLSATTVFYAEARRDSSGCTSASRTPVNAIIHPLPVPSLRGPHRVCTGSPGNLYSTEPFMKDYFWSVTQGGIITGGAGTNHILVTWATPGIQQVTVNYSDSIGCRGGRPALLNVRVDTSPDTTGPISGPQDICAGTNGVLYFVAPVADAEVYYWTVPAGVVITSGTGTDSITVNFAADAPSGYITVFASDSCGDGHPAQLYVSVNQPPVALAGPDDTICGEHPYMITHAQASGYSGLLWTTNGQGSLTEESTLFPTYYPLAGETGPVVLTLTAYGESNCGNDTSQMTVWIAGMPFVNAGPDNSVCESRPFPVTGAFASNYQSLEWTTGGTGQFSDPHTFQPVYIPGIEDVQKGHVMLTLKATPSAPCIPLSDSMILTILKAPIVSAGPGVITCENLSITITGASASNYDNLVWNHNGQGSLTGEKTLTPVYLPGAGETGDVLLTLTAFGEEACSDSSAGDQTWIRIYPSVISNAGPDLLIPYGSPVTLSGSVNGGSGIFRYSWEPASLLLNDTTLNPITISLVSDTSFILKATDLMTGCTDSDSV